MLRDKRLALEVRVLAIAASCAGQSLNAQATITGTVYDSLLSHRPLNSAVVLLIEQRRTTTTDLRGRFRFEGVPAGTWTLSFMHPSLDSLELSAPRTRVDLSGAGVTMVQLATPSALTVLRQLCPARTDSTTGVVIGRVRTVSDGRRVAGARISSAWTEFTLERGGVRRDLTRVSAMSDTSGAYILCGVPVEIRSEIAVTRGDHEAGPVGLEFGPTPLRALDLVLALEDSAEGGLTGIVRAEDGYAIANAEISVLGTKQRQRTGPDGRFRFSRVRAGTRELEAQRIGSAPVRVAVVVPMSADASVDVVFGRTGQPLPAVAVAGTRSWYDRSGFDERRLSKPGFFLTADQIRNLYASDLADLLYHAPGVEGRWVNGHRVISLISSWMQWELPPIDEDTRGPDLGCTPRVFLDGQVFFDTPWAPALSLVMMTVRPEDVYGIEMYRPDSYTPPQFKDPLGCSSIVVWTK